LWTLEATNGADTVPKVCGLLTRWDQEGQCLIALRSEHVRKFLLDSIRLERIEALQKQGEYEDLGTRVVREIPALT